MIETETNSTDNMSLVQPPILPLPFRDAANSQTCNKSLPEPMEITECHDNGNKNHVTAETRYPLRNRKPPERLEYK